MLGAGLTNGKDNRSSYDPVVMRRLLGGRGWANANRLMIDQSVVSTAASNVAEPAFLDDRVFPGPVVIEFHGDTSMIPRLAATPTDTSVSARSEMDAAMQ